MSNSENYPVGGYTGKILRIDLSTGTVECKTLPEEIALNYVGGRGLATRLLMDQIDPGCDPFGSENALVIATSPLTGLPVTTGGRGHVVFKSPLTGVIGTSNSGGDWAVALKGSGFDALILKGKSPFPVYLSISGEGKDLTERVKDPSCQRSLGTGYAQRYGQTPGPASFRDVESSGYRPCRREERPLRRFDQ